MLVQMDDKDRSILRVEVFHLRLDRRGESKQGNADDPNGTFVRNAHPHGMRLTSSRHVHVQDESIATLIFMEGADGEELL